MHRHRRPIQHALLADLPLAALADVIACSSSAASRYRSGSRPLAIDDLCLVLGSHAGAAGLGLELRQLGELEAVAAGLEARGHATLAARAAIHAAIVVAARAVGVCLAAELGAELAAQIDAEQAARQLGLELGPPGG